MVKDDKKYHELRKSKDKSKYFYGTDTLCGKTAVNTVRIGTGGEYVNINQVCPECWKLIKENN